MKSEELKHISEEADVRNAKTFWDGFKDELFQRMKRNAETGCREFRVDDSDDSLNKHGWLKASNLYKKAIAELEQLGYTVNHSNDVKDGT